MIPVETFITWKWKHPTYHTKFTSQHVNVLASMVKRNYARPHRFVCVTDDPVGLAPGIEALPLENEAWAQIPNPSIKNGPSCYRRLAMFKPDAEKVFGQRFVSLDLDCVITGDLIPLLDKEEDFCIWGDTSKRNKYNGSIILMTAGCRAKVWNDFSPVLSPRKTQAVGYLGSDQAWIAYCLGKNERVFGRADGVYSFRNHLENKTKELPANCKIVFFHGVRNPWDADAQQEYGWIGRNWI